MKLRYIVIISLFLLTILTLAVLLISKYVQPILPPNINTSFLLAISITSGIVSFLAAFKDIIELIEKFFGRSSTTIQKQYVAYFSYHSMHALFVETVAMKLREKMKLKQKELIWLHTEQIYPGQSYEKAINAAIDASRVFIILIDEPHISSAQVNDLQRAIVKEIPVIPVLLDTDYRVFDKEELSSLKGRRAVFLRGTGNIDDINDEELEELKRGIDQLSKN